MSTTQKREQELEEIEPNKKMKSNTSTENIAVQHGEILTNLRTIEVEYENKEIELDMDWDNRIKQRRLEIEQEEQERSQKRKYKEIREQSWELNRLSRKFLEENDKEWAKRKEIREQERNRKLRLEKAGLL